MKTVVKIDDIAVAVGVSKSTVSRVLNNRDTVVAVSPKTRQRILDAASQLQYRPNILARGLRTRTSHIVGIVVRDVTNPFWGRLIKGIIERCSIRGYHVILSNSASESEEQEASSMFLGDVGADGLIVIGDFPGDAGIVQEALQSCPHAVAVCRALDPNIAPVIRVDDRGGFRLLLDYIHGLGHRRIGFIGMARPEGYADRYAEYRAYLGEHDLTIDEALIAIVDRPGFPSEDELVEIGEEATKRVLATSQAPDALVCACDPMALGALRVARDSQLTVPGDLSIGGFDDTALARYCTPSLTTIRQPVAEMGRAAADLLLDLIAGNKERPREAILFTPELVVRESTGRPW